MCASFHQLYFGKLIGRLDRIPTYAVLGVTHFSSFAGREFISWRGPSTTSSHISKAELCKVMLSYCLYLHNMSIYIYIPSCYFSMSAKWSTSVCVPLHTLLPCLRAAPHRDAPTLLSGALCGCLVLENFSSQFHCTNISSSPLLNTGLFASMYFLCAFDPTHQSPASPLWQETHFGNTFSMQGRISSYRQPTLPINGMSIIFSCFHRLPQRNPVTNLLVWLWRLKWRQHVSPSWFWRRSRRW